MTFESDGPIELLRIGDEKAPVIISLSKFKGMRFIDIRRYYFDKNAKALRPTQKGIALKEDEFAIFAEFILKNILDLQSLFVSELSAIELTSRGTSLERKARKKVSATSIPATYKLTSWPSMEFFSIDASSPAALVSFNSRIRLISKIEETAPEFFNYLKDIVMAYHSARNSFNFDSKQKPSDVLENIELEWARNLNVQQ
jgi:hypothetical protein